MAAPVAMITLLLLFTAGLTLWRCVRRWRPARALLMMLPVTICGMLVFSLGVSKQHHGIGRSGASGLRRSP